MTDLLDTPFTIIFVIDILLNFNVVIKNDDGTSINDRYDIAIHYLKGWFWLDLLSSIPFGVIFDQLNADLLRGSKALKLIRFIKLLRVLKITKVSLNMKNNEITKMSFKFFKVHQG